MQLAELKVHKLFQRHSHSLTFPTFSEDESNPSLTIIHGPNGVGKTTILRMLNGAMELDFDAFRAVPFDTFELTFNTGHKLEVRDKGDEGIEVSYDSSSVLLSRAEKGAARPNEQPAVDELREKFNADTEAITLTYVDADRQLSSIGSHPGWKERQTRALARQMMERSHAAGLVSETLEDGIISSRPKDLLSRQVRHFIRDAQLDYRKFFSSGEPDLLPRIIENLRSFKNAIPPKDVIASELHRVHKQEQTHARLGLIKEPWEYDNLTQILEEIAEGESEAYALVALNTYVEFLASRADARQLIAERLITFEEVLGDFFGDKNVTVDARRGLKIRTNQGAESSKTVLLNESQLSSGEYQLLFLMVAALTTTRRGTVIAIDEPELSIHIAWQRKLVANLIKCASRAAPQIILATHSPDIAAAYPENMVKLTPYGD